TDSLGGRAGGPSFAVFAKGGILMLAFFPKNLNTYKASGGIEIKNSKPHPLSAADKGWGTQNIPGASSVGRPPKYSEGASPARGSSRQEMARLPQPEPQGLCPLGCALVRIGGFVETGGNPRPGSIPSPRSEDGRVGKECRYWL